LVEVFNNLRGFNIDVTEGRDLGSRPLRWRQVAYDVDTKYYEDRCKHSEVTRGDEHADTQTNVDSRVIS
jgi:hypothetical protein